MKKKQTNNRRPKRGVLIGLLMLWAITGAFAGVAFAQSDSPLAATLKVEKIVTGEDGKEALASAERAKPGELLQYTAVYENKSSGALQNVAATMPIPTGLIYEPSDAYEQPLSASVDGKTFGAIPLTRPAVDSNGLITRVKVPLSEYRYLRWAGRNLDAKSTFTVKARARVIPVDQTAAITPKSEEPRK